MDLRLVPLSLSVWLSCAFTISVVSTRDPVFAVFWFLVAAASMAWIVRFRNHVSLALIGIGVITGIAITCLRVFPLRDALISTVSDQHATVVVSGLISGDLITARRTSGLDWSDSTFTVINISARTIETRGNSYNISLPMTIMANEKITSTLVPGTLITAKGRISPAQLGRNSAAIIHSFGVIEVMRGPPRYQSLAYALRQQLHRNLAHTPAAAAQLVPGLALGDSSAMGQELASDMRNSGLSHLIAVSGANVALIVIAVLRLTSGFARRTQIVFAVIAICAFVVLVRPSPSVVRAATMGIVVLLVSYVRPHSSPLPALALAVLGLVFYDPWLAISYGFALSVFATAGLLLFAERANETTARWWPRVPQWMTQVIGVTLICQVAVLPLMVALGATLTWASIPANAIAVPLAGFVMGAGLVSALVGIVWDPLGNLTAWLPAIPALLIAQVAHMSASAASLVIDWPHGIVGVLSASLIVVIALVELVKWSSRSPQHRGIACLVILAIAWQSMSHHRLTYISWPPLHWSVAMCDVGQGDTTVIRVESHSAVVIDAGPDPALVDRCLRDLAITEVPLVIFTHFHADHVGGFNGILNKRKVGEVFLPPFGEPAMMKQFVTQTLTRAHLSSKQLNYLQRIEVPSSLQKISLVCIWPERFISDQGSDVNNASVVLNAVIGNSRYLFSGDIEPAAQDAIVAAMDLAQVDVLKMPHHGSAHQSVEFALRTRPKFVTVSVGADNDYGHPAATALNLYESLGGQVFRTDLSGDISFIETNQGGKASLSVQVRR